VADRASIDPPDAGRRDPVPGLERLVFFSDAVFAIAITLLALDLRLPDVPGLTNESFLRLLEDLGVRYFAFFISFAVIGRYWWAHHTMFRLIATADSGLAFLDLVFLFFIVQVPLLSSILGQHGDLALPTIVYAVGTAAIGLAAASMWIYAARRGLLVAGVPAATVTAVTIRMLAVPALFLLSIPIALFSPTLATVSWLSIGFIPRLLARQVTARRASRGEAAS
jgi:uncharacterized membrane protein